MLIMQFKCPISQRSFEMLEGNLTPETLFSLQMEVQCWFHHYFITISCESFQWNFSRDPITFSSKTGNGKVSDSLHMPFHTLTFKNTIKREINKRSQDKTWRVDLIPEARDEDSFRCNRNSCFFISHLNNDRLWWTWSPEGIQIFNDGIHH